MTFQSIGDLVQHFQTRRDTARMTAQVARLTDELGSGRKADLAETVRGDFRPLSAIRHRLTLMESFARVRAEAALRAEMIQTHLESVQTAGRTAADALMGDAADRGAGLSAAGETARHAFETAIGALNGDAGGQTLFAGQAVDRAALVAPDDMLSDLQTLVSGAVSAADALSLVETYFGAGGGYETTAYLGDAQPLQPVRLSESDRVALDVTALAPEIRATLAGLAAGALLDGGVPGLSDLERARLADLAGAKLRTTEEDLIGLRAGIGAAEDRIDRVDAASAAEQTSLELARGRIEDADPYATASALEAARLQLETLYAATARLSDLSLTRYLR